MELAEKKDTKIILEQYKIIVESAEKTSTKRAQSNGFFITVNTAVFATMSLAFEGKTISVDQLDLYNILSFFGIILNLIWFINIKTYKKINSAKFKVINELEEMLPCQPFKDEWKKLKEKKYITLTQIETWIPFVIIILFICVLIKIN